MILVAGGTGTLGSKLVGQLIAGEEPVRILVRNPAKASPSWGDDVEVAAGDVRDPASVERALAGVRVVVSAITGFGMARDVSPSAVDWQGNVRLIRAAKAAGVDQFVLISVCQAGPDHPSLP